MSRQPLHISKKWSDPPLVARVEWVDQDGTLECFMIPLNLWRNNRWTLEKIKLVNLRVEVNLVSELLTKEAGWTSLRSRRTIIMGINGQAVTSHNVYKIRMKIKDS
jgi:hypothetical protein